MSKRYFITGASSGLGYEIKQELLRRGEDNVFAPDKKSVDLTHDYDVIGAIHNYRPHEIFHCAEWTDIDQAERYPDAARRLNHEATKNVVKSAESVGAKLVYLSSARIFDGAKESPYGVNDPANPLSVYGTTKYDGERVVARYDKSFIIRTSWLFGAHGYNFAKAILDKAEKQDGIVVINDQFASPTYMVDLAKLMIDIANTTSYGTYHATNMGACSRAEFASFILRRSLRYHDVRIQPVPTEEYPEHDMVLTPNKYMERTWADRPKNAQLKSALPKGVQPLPSWQDAVMRFLKEMGVQGAQSQRLELDMLTPALATA